MFIRHHYAFAVTYFIKNPYPKTEELIVEGEKIYRALCLTCHGEFGDGNLNPPSISFINNK